MKILTGSLKDRPILFKPHPSLRATPDKVRKAVIQVLGEKLRDAVVLDVFAGTGAMGLEALSVGAREAHFIEKNGPLCLNIERMLMDYGLSGRAQVWRTDALTALRTLALDKAAFDVILADPPYESGEAKKLLKVLEEDVLLKPDGWLVLETYKREELPTEAGPLTLKRRSVYGDTAVHYYLRSEVKVK